MMIVAVLFGVKKNSKYLKDEINNFIVIKIL